MKSVLLAMFSLSFQCPSAWAVPAVVNSLPPAKHIAKQKPVPEGAWKLEKLRCGQNGNSGKLRYESAKLVLDAGTAVAELIQEACEISLDGTYSTIDTTMTTEFSSGSWNACSGGLPTYVLNRFEYRREGNDLILTGTDLQPFATCRGEGELHFIAD